MDEAAVVQLLVAGVAAVVVLGTCAEGVRVRRAVGDLGVSGAALAPGVERLALSLRIGEGAAVPGACEDDVGAAEVGRLENWNRQNAKVAKGRGENRMDSAKRGDAEIAEKSAEN